MRTYFSRDAILTLKASIRTAADDIHKYFFIVFLDVSSDSSENQALFSSKDKIKKLKCRLLQFLFGVLRVNENLAQTELHNITNESSTLTPKVGVRSSQYLDGYIYIYKKTELIPLYSLLIYNPLIYCWADIEFFFLSSA